MRPYSKIYLLIHSSPSEVDPYFLTFCWASVNAHWNRNPKKVTSAILKCCDTKKIFRKFSVNILLTLKILWYQEECFHFHHLSIRFKIFLRPKFYLVVDRNLKQGFKLCLYLYFMYFIIFLYIMNYFLSNLFTIKVW